MSNCRATTRVRRSRLRSFGRGGITLVEIVAAASVLAVLLATAVQMLSALAERQRAAERRTLAMATAQAVVEQLANMRWDELTPQAAERLAVPPEAEAYLPGAKLAVDVIDEQEPIAAKRIFVQLTWTGLGGQPAGPVRLTAWSFPDEPREE